MELLKKDTNMANLEAKKLLEKTTPLNEHPETKNRQYSEITLASFTVSSITSFFTTADYYICIYFIKVLMSAYCPLYYSEAIG